MLSPDGNVLFYSQFGLSSVTIHWATFDPKTGWVPKGTLDAPELNAVGAQRRRPTGISGDLRTLFYWDETAESEKAAWRLTSDGVFNIFSDLGPLWGATPGANCVGLYYSVAPMGPPVDAGPPPDGGILVDGGVPPAPPPPPPPQDGGAYPKDIFRAFPQ